MACTSRFEQQVRGLGYRLVAGVDEAGRGCLFGPVYAAAVILDPQRPIRGLNDSKQLDPDQRERLARLIRERALGWSVASAEAEVIDRINILEASRLAMRMAIEKLEPAPEYVLVDAIAIETPLPQRAVVHGDALSRSIAAASILAKVERDASMAEWDRLYPDYGFIEHKGYGTPRHLEALARLGVTPHHRLSFEPVRQIACPSPQLALFAEA